jgi:hypothetical protein
MSVFLVEVVVLEAARLEYMSASGLVEHGELLAQRDQTPYSSCLGRCCLAWGFPLRVSIRALGALLDKEAEPPTTTAWTVWSKSRSVESRMVHTSAVHEVDNPGVLGVSRTDFSAAAAADSMTVTPAERLVILTSSGLR